MYCRWAPAEFPDFRCTHVHKNALLLVVFRLLSTKPWQCQRRARRTLSSGYLSNGGEVLRSLRCKYTYRLLLVPPERHRRYKTDENVCDSHLRKLLLSFMLKFTLTVVVYHFSYSLYISQQCKWHVKNNNVNVFFL